MGRTWRAGSIGHVPHHQLSRLPRHLCDRGRGTGAPDHGRAEIHHQAGREYRRGSTEKEVRHWFAGFRAEPHKYQAAPAKYLTAPNAASDPALRFEIGDDGKVTLIHVGTMPVLGYVEGCA